MTARVIWTKPASCALFAPRSRPRIPRILMRREEVDGRIVVEDPLRAIAVMNVPIDDRDPFDLRIFALRVAGCNRDVVEKTEAHRSLFRRVMSGRPNGNERVRRLVAHD